MSPLQRPTALNGSLLIPAAAWQLRTATGQAIDPRQTRMFPGLLLADGTKSRRNDAFARETPSMPAEPHVALRVALYHRLHHVRAKTPTGRRMDRRTSGLSPPKHQLSIFRARPLDTNLTCGHG